MPFSFSQLLSVTRTALVTASLLTLAACGGGGSDNPGPKFSRSSSMPSVPSSSSSTSKKSSSSKSSSSSSSANTDLTWSKGVFGAPDDYRSKCEAPRSGIAPHNNQPYPDQAGSSTHENFFLRSLTHNYYLWYDEVVDIDPALYSTPDYFARMKTTQKTPTGTPKDQFHWSTPSDEYHQLTEAGIEAGYGAAWVVWPTIPPREAVVAFVQPNSPADKAGLTRGAKILEIDGVDLVHDDTETGVNTLNAGLFPKDVTESHTFKVLDLNASSSRTITLTSTEVIIAPTPTVKTLTTNTGTVGYILFNDHIATAETALISAIDQLRGAGVNDLVLDIRYNGGGYLDIANQLAYMIAGTSAANKTFSDNKFNNKHRYFNPFSGVALMPTKFHQTTLGFSEDPGQTLPTLNLGRVFVLTSGNTCSASEAIINSLAGIDIEVVQIGTPTCGKPYGAYTIDNCGETYFTVQFKSANAKGYGEYSDGFFPGNGASSNPAELPGCEENPGDYAHLLGDPDEALLAAALHYRKTGSCPTAMVNKNQNTPQKTRPNTSGEGLIYQPPGLGDMILRR